MHAPARRDTTDNRDRGETEVESQLRRGAAFCRRVAAVALVVAFAGSMAAGFSIERDSAGGLSLGAVLAVMLLSILGVLLFACLLFMAARTMDALAGVWPDLARPLGDVATRAARADDRQSRAEAAELEQGVSPPSPVGDLGWERLSWLPVEPASGRPVSLTGAVETIRLGGFVKVTTSAGWTGWVRDTDLPPIDPKALPRTPAGIPYRPPMPSLSPGRPPR